MKQDTGPRGGCTLVLFGLALLLTICFAALSIGRAAELSLPPLNAPVVRGNYGDAFYARRWRKLCAGGGRYQAMSEAHEIGKPNPCETPYRCTSRQREAGECL